MSQILVAKLLLWLSSNTPWSSLSRSTLSNQLSQDQFSQDQLNEINSYVFKSNEQSEWQTCNKCAYIKSNLEVLCYISMLLNSHSETVLQNWIGQTSSGFASPFASPVFVLGPAVLQLPAFSSVCISWRHRWSHRCWDVIYLPLFQPWMPPFNMVVD